VRNPGVLWTTASRPAAIRHRSPVPPVPQIPVELREDVFRGCVAVAAGLLSRRRLAGQSWRRLFHDVYVHRDVPVTHELLARAAVVLLPDAVVTGRSAAVLWGVELAGPEDDVEVTLPPDSHMVRVRGLHARRAALDPAHVGRRRGVRTTSPEATALRLAAVLSQDAAVTAVDRLVATGTVDLTGIRRLAALARGPGSARARTVAALADGLAESPQETRLRLLVGRSPLPLPVAQFTVRHENRFVARVDFAWPEQKVALEYDGLWHAEAGQFARDRQRLNRLQAAGWRVVFVTAADLHDPVQLVARIAAALAR
jgi:hypothetical protein